MSSVSETANNINGALLQYVRVNCIADYYDMQDLAQLANRKLQETLKQHAVSADKKGCIQPQTLCTAVDECFRNSSDPDIHNIISKAAAENLERLNMQSEFPKIYGIGDSANSIIKKLLGRMERLRTDSRKEVDAARADAQRQKVNSIEDVFIAEQATHSAETRIARIRSNLLNLNIDGRCQNMNCGRTGTGIRGRGSDPDSFLLVCYTCKPSGFTL